MRLLSNDEKEFCKKILSGDGKDNCLENIIDKDLYKVRIYIIRDNKKVELLFESGNNSPTDDEFYNILKRIDSISIKIITLVNLINMLEKDGYVMLVQRAHQLNNDHKFGQGAENLPYMTYSFPDPKISELLTEYTTKEIIITDEFKRFCEHDFIARDEQRFSKQFCISICALLITSVALIVNILSNSNIFPKRTDKTKVTSMQIETLEHSIKEINSNITNISNTMNQNNTKILEELKRNKIVNKSVSIDITHKKTKANSKVE